MEKIEYNHQQKKVSEKTLDANLKKYIEQLGGKYQKMHTLTCAGIPDRLVLMPKGRAFFVELKSQGKVPTKLQKFWLDTLSNLGFKTFVVFDYISILDAKLHAKSLSDSRE